MLQKLKNMLTIAPTVDFVGFEDGLLIVRSKKALKTNNTTIKLKTHLGTVVAHVLVESYDTESQVYRLTLFEHESILEPLDNDRRECPRLLKVLRVTSHAFAGYSANTEDISTGGIRVRTSGPLETKQVIDFQMERRPPDSASSSDRRGLLDRHQSGWEVSLRLEISATEYEYRAYYRTLHQRPHQYGKETSHHGRSRAADLGLGDHS